MNTLKTKFKNIFSKNVSKPDNLIRPGGDVSLVKSSSFTSVPKRPTYPYLIRDKDPRKIWELGAEIGDGAFSKVYRVVHKENKTIAAAKVISNCKEEDLNEHMIEAQILKDCNHKNILKFFEVYFYQNTLWFIIEYCSIGAVDLIMVDMDMPLKEVQIKYIINETLEALKYLHENRFVIHRDLKAGNILLNELGEVKIADYGVSAKNDRKNQTRNTFIGTPYWMSPDIIKCEADKDLWYDYKIDIWSLGITCIELAEKEPPNNTISPYRVLTKILKADSPRLKHEFKWSPEFIDFVDKCLQKNPDLRPTANELLKHPFLRNANEKKPHVLQLISEYKKLNDSALSSDDNNVRSKATTSLSSNDVKIPNIIITQATDLSTLSLEKNEKLDKLSELIYSDLLQDVLTSEYEKPSVPDIILEIIREFFEKQKL